MSEIRQEEIIIHTMPFMKDKITECAKKQNKTVEEYILDAVDLQMGIDEGGQEIPPEVIVNSIEWLKNHGHTDKEIVDFVLNWSRNS